MKSVFERSNTLTPVSMRLSEADQNRIPLKEYSNKFLREAKCGSKTDEELLGQYKRLQNGLKNNKLKKRQMYQLARLQSNNYETLESQLVSTRSPCMPTDELLPHRRDLSPKFNPNTSRILKLDRLTPDLPLHRRLFTENSDGYYSKQDPSDKRISASRALQLYSKVISRERVKTEQTNIRTVQTPNDVKVKKIVLSCKSKRLSCNVRQPLSGTENRKELPPISCHSRPEREERFDLRGWQTNE